MGWSMKKMLAFSFQEYGLKVELSGWVTLQGPALYILSVIRARANSQCRHLPSSMKRPRDEEHPGPPLVQKTTSSLAGSFLLSKK